MAYTTYPEEASGFSSKGDDLAGKLLSMGSELTNIYSVFHVDTNEDYLTLKTMEANEKILDIINKGISAIDNDIVSVNEKAYELEQEEVARQKLLKEKDDDITEEDTTT